MKLILVPRPSSLATTVLVFVEAGSKYQTKEINGISHFLEHMCFKGTKKRPRPIDIASELDGLGAQYNAFTSQELTSYYVKAKNESLDNILEIITDVYLNTVFEPKEINKERGVIIEEMNMYEDMPKRKAQDLFMELLYGDQPAGWDITGTKEVIRRLKREDFLKYRQEHYLAQVTTLVIAGKFEEEDIVKKINNHFTSLKKGKKTPKPDIQELQEKPAELIKFKKSDQTHIVLGFRAFDTFDKRRFILEVLSDVLGGGMGSRLFQKIREELGAAYYVGAGADLYSDHGLIAMAAGINHQRTEEVIKATLEEFMKLKDELVGEEELKRVKEHLIGHLFLSLETTDELGIFYGIQEVMRMPLMSPELIAENIKAVTAEDIQTLSRDLFKNKGLNMSVIGPFKEKSFSDILKI